MKVVAKIEKLILPTYEEPPREELPMFAENRVHQRSSGNPYPNKIVARVDREHRVDKEYIAVRLENEYVSVVILPEIGGRIYSATDKITGYDFFYKQHVIKPALIGVLGSWISGGVEFNWPFHHRASGYMACDFHIEECEDGSAICHLSEHDPIDRMKGAFSIVLRPGERFFETRMRLYNRTNLPHSFLWWENAAVPVNEEYQIFFPQDVKYVNFHYLKSRTTYPIAGNGVYNGIPMKEARDISFHKNTREATSYFASASDYDFFGGYDHGKRCGVVHIGDHHVSPGKKMFTWAYGQLSKSWENALTDTDGQYAELMAGSYSDNQPDFSWLAPYETKQFSQYWYPIFEIGTPTFANLNAAFRIDRQSSLAKLHLQVCKAYPNAHVRVFDGESIYLDVTEALTPDRAYKWSIGKIPVFVSVEITDENGAEIAAYTEQSFDEYNMPDVITDMPEAAKMTSAQELYLAGVHVDQYRDPATKPDAYWKEALKREINHIPSLIAMARYEYSLNHLQDALEYSKRALAATCQYNAHPISGEVYYVHAQILEAMKDFKRAYDHYYKAAFAADCVAKAMTRVAVLDVRKRDYREAIRHAEWALEYGNKNSLAHAVLVISHRELGENDAADRICDAVLASDPLDQMMRYLAKKADFYSAMQSDPAQTCLDLASDFDAMGRYADAKALLDDLIAQRPQFAYFIVCCMRAYYGAMCGEATGDLDLLDSAEIGPTYPVRRIEAEALAWGMEQSGNEECRMLLGCMLYHQREYRRAAELWQTCTHSYIAKRNLAVAYFSHLGKENEALEIMRNLLQTRPEDEALLYETVVLMNKLGCNPKEKIDLIQSHSVTRDDVLTELAKSYNQAGEYQKAIDTLLSHAFVPCEGGEHAIADQYMFAYLAMGIQAMKAGDFAKALELLRCGQILPQSLGAGIWNHCKRIPLRYYAAICHEKLGNKEEAEAIYRYISETEIEYFSNMHLGELPYYQALSFDRLGMPLHSRKLITEYRRRWEAMIDVKDNGFFATTPFFMSFVDDPKKLRRARWLYLTGLCESYLGNREEAEARMRESYMLNNDQLIAKLYVE
ncbi:MAG: DUF5107 domain-containing protein [Clostridia bacterium]|nr:DUF5107 domain-containing protein [Clostridia bacterium]